MFTKQNTIVTRIVLTIKLVADRRNQYVQKNDRTLNPNGRKTKDLK
jgi:hypothetical protein